MWSVSQIHTDPLHEMLCSCESLFPSTEQICCKKERACYLRGCHDLSALGNAGRVSPNHTFHLIVQVLVGRQTSHSPVAEVHLLRYLKVHCKSGMTIQH